MTENISLIDGKTYQFKLNKRVCSGVFLLGDSKRQGAFYCNGSAVCGVSDASQIERLYSEADLNNTVSAMVAESEGRVTNKHLHHHVINSLVNEFDFGYYGNSNLNLVGDLEDWAIKKDVSQKNK